MAQKVAKKINHEVTVGKLEELAAQGPTLTAEVEMKMLETMAKAGGDSVWSPDHTITYKIAKKILSGTNKQQSEGLSEMAQRVMADRARPFGETHDVHYHKITQHLEYDSTDIYLNGVQHSPEESVRSSSCTGTSA